MIRFLCLFFSGALLLAGCTPEVIRETPELTAPLYYLNYDAENETAPELPGGGYYEGSIRFTRDQMGAYAGDQLEGVYFFIEEVPDACSVRIYTGDPQEEPETLIYQADVLDVLEPTQWHRHMLETPIALAEEALWVAIRFSHADAARTLGCDPGPADTDGDWLFDSVDSDWLPLRTRAPQISINWNIRTVVRPM